MDISYSPNKLEKSLTNDKLLLATYGERAKKLKQRMNELVSSNTLLDMSKIPAARLHPLKGNRNKEWAVDIYKNWRICFEIAGNPIPMPDDKGIDLSKVSQINIISVVDYH